MTETLTTARMGDYKSRKILVVDDDPGLVTMLETKLILEGFEVLTARSGLQALNVIEQHGLPHLAIVDIVMPEMDGLAFCQAVQAFSDFPIIMLTSVDDEETTVHALNLYAEDYVIKPFRPRELIARVRRVLRRLGDSVYTFDQATRVDDRLVVDFTHQRVIVNGETIEMTPTETKLLYILLRQAGQVSSMDYLQHRLWPHGAVVEEALRVNIHRLRQKIEPDPRNPIYLHTHRGEGYRFSAPSRQL